MKKKIQDRIRSFKFAFAGIFQLFQNEPNAKVHLLMAILVIFGGFILQISLIEWTILILCIVLVFAAEAFNTAIEKLTDRVSTDIHPLSAQVKDLAAAGVLLTAIGAAICGFLIFLPKIWLLLMEHWQ